MDLYSQAIRENPDFIKIREQIDNAAQTADGSKARASVIFIPVVVHVVYRTADENISNAQIQSQIDVLNEDFGRSNADASQTPTEFLSVATDTEIRFCLAQRTPSGQPSDGITRTQTTAMSFGLGGAVKNEATGGKSPWPSNQYLNIWVCNLTSPLIGFATLPGSAAPGQDGVVIIYKHFGRTGNVQAPYNKGRTATHEVGHWLNLLHIWGDDESSSDNCAGTDQVGDTPNQAAPYFGCPSGPVSSCGSSDMYMNFMDYTDDQCMNVFTRDQKIRMQSTLNGFRSSLQSSQGCMAVPVANDCDTLNNITGGDGLVYYRCEEYFGGETGYLTGTNSRGDLAFAEKFNTSVEKAIYGVGFDFSFAFESAQGASIKVLVWDASGDQGSPGAILNQTTFPISTIINNVENFTFTNVEFNLPALVTGDYYLGFETNILTGDSIAVYTNQFDEININSGWIRLSDGSWLPCESPDAFDGALSLAIRAIQCSTVGITPLKEVNTATLIYPNPSSSGNFSVQLPENFGKSQWQVFSMEGKAVASGNFSSSQYQSLNIDSADGIYYLRIIPEAKDSQVIPIIISGN
ncbi:MAG: M43 family zinc metalloprotease [Bacteroidia bacterium]